MFDLTETGMVFINPSYVIDITNVPGDTPRCQVKMSNGDVHHCDRTATEMADRLRIM